MIVESPTLVARLRELPEQREEAPAGAQDRGRGREADRVDQARRRRGAAEAGAAVDLELPAGP